MTRRKPIKRDESYILDLCDEVLGQVALRQHRFDFLRGDPGKRSKGVMLPVDAYYEEHKLVIEYRERQHSEPVKFFDKRVTVSRVSRGEQRAKYDQRRRDELPKHGIELVEFSCDDFKCDVKKRLIRDKSRDEQVVRAKLAKRIRRVLIDAVAAQFDRCYSWSATRDIQTSTVNLGVNALRAPNSAYLVS